MELEIYWNTLRLRANPQIIEFIGTLAIQLLFFWLPATIYLSIDHLFPTFSHRHKLQPQLKQPTASEIKDCLYVVLRNQVISGLIHVSLLTLGYLSGGKPVYDFSPKLPSYQKLISDVIFCVVLREVLFYYCHRILHLPALYPKIHKVHHRFTAPVALAAQYAHPLEHFFANTLPISIPPILWKCHIVTFWVFLAFELFETSTVHSGYDFLHGSAKMHDLHHEKFNVYFGAVGFLDWLHGTDVKGKERAKAKKV
ncbi:MAG: hypothetical protein MMC33_009839 [Icmadophila ericetorum]|nr:hypothetical protein [Icmadophila ericetorum]